MNKKAILAKIQELYKNNENIIQYLRDNVSNSGCNSIEDIMIAYDFQTGRYNYLDANDPFYHDKHVNTARKLNNEISKLCGCTTPTILEAGVGEATFLRYVLESMNYKMAYGFDISWSRVKEGLAHMKRNNISKVELFAGDLFNIPLQDNSIDIVYTRQAIEPNGGHEREIVRELYRVTKNYLILIEPAYDMANDDAKERMKKHGYIQKLPEAVNELGYKVIKYEKMPDDCSVEYEPTAIMVIEKDNSEVGNTDCIYRCPATGAIIERYTDAFFSKKSLLAYPIVGGVPLLMESNAIVATHYCD